jgi:hypothetical protein
MSDRRGAEAETLDSHQPFPAREYELPAGQKSPDLIRAERTVWRLAHIHFAWDINKALEFALLESFAVPSISGLLERTGEFKESHAQAVRRHRHPCKRSYEHRSRQRPSEARLYAHQRHARALPHRQRGFSLRALDLRFQPIDWLERFGRRGMTHEEKEAWFFYWREFGRRMGIAALPEDLAAFRTFAQEFEKTRFGRVPSNRAVAEPTIDLLLRQYFVPPLLYPAGRRFVMALCSPHLVEALGYPAPSSALRLLAESVMGLRRTILRRLPEGTRPKYIPFGKETYPEGYTIEDLGCVQA